MKPGDHVRLRTEEEIMWDSAIFEWDHTLLFPTREHARDMIGWIGNIMEGTNAIVLACDSNFVQVLTSDGIGWSRTHYWEVLT